MQSKLLKFTVRIEHNKNNLNTHFLENTASSTYTYRKKKQCSFYCWIQGSFDGWAPHSKSSRRILVSLRCRIRNIEWRALSYIVVGDDESSWIRNGTARIDLRCYLSCLIAWSRDLFRAVDPRNKPDSTRRNENLIKSLFSRLLLPCV